LWRIATAKKGSSGNKQHRKGKRNKKGRGVDCKKNPEEGYYLRLLPGQYTLSQGIEFISLYRKRKKFYRIGN